MHVHRTLRSTAAMTPRKDARGLKMNRTESNGVAPAFQQEAAYVLASAQLRVQQASVTVTQRANGVKMHCVMEVAIHVSASQPCVQHQQQQQHVNNIPNARGVKMESVCQRIVHSVHDGLPCALGSARQVHAKNMRSVPGVKRYQCVAHRHENLFTNCKNDLLGCAVQKTVRNVLAGLPCVQPLRHAKNVQLMRNACGACMANAC
jgi:hypothetical protein